MSEVVPISTVSLRELAITHTKGRLPHSHAESIESVKLDEVPITRRHLLALSSIESPHAEAFDRMLMAQAVADGSVLVTADRDLLGSASPTIPATR